MAHKFLMNNKRRTRRSRSHPTHGSFAEGASRWATVALQILSLTGIWLTALGFGASLALDSFGVDVLEVIGSPVDLLRISAFPVVQAFTNVIERLHNVDLAGKDLMVATPVTAAMVTIAVAMALTIVGRPAWRQCVADKYRVVRNRLPSLLELRVLQWWRMPAIAASSALVTWCVVRAARFLPVGVSAFMLMPFGIGYLLSDQYFFENVVQPLGCRPLASANNRRAVYIQRKLRDLAETQGSDSYAVCVSVKVKDGSERRGRRVIATTDSIVLFDPSTGQVSTVPRKNAVVSTIAKL